MTTTQASRPSIKVTCVIPSFNRPRLLKDAIESVREQTLPAWQLVIADDDSNAETRAVIEAAAASDSRIQVTYAKGVTPSERTARLRYCVGINRAIPLATGEYLHSLPDDDYLSPRAFELLAAALDQNPDIAVAYGRLRSITYDASADWDSAADPRAGRSYAEFGEIDPESGKPVNPATWEPGLRVLANGGGLDHSQVMVRRAAVLALGGGGWWPEVPEGPLGVGDALFFDRLHRAGHQALAVDAVVTNKRYHGRSYGRVSAADPRRE